MTWTGRPDNVACCGDVPGPVLPEETVVRLIHNRIDEPAAAAFTRKDLCAPEGEFDNTCGLADGGSVDRNSNLTDQEVCARADALAALKDGRKGSGGRVALVNDLRGIVHSADPNNQAVYVYDDPMIGNQEHAVMRVSAAIPRADFDEVRTKVIAAFSGRIAPPAA